MTKAAQLLEEQLDQRWPALVFQRYNCRPIAGSSTWSQHSWPGGNARDIFGPDLKASPSSQALLDEVHVHLKANKTKLGIKTLLWRVKDHYNHIHVDMWPTGYGKPPCGGGAERYRYPDNRIVSAKDGNVTPLGTFEPILEEEGMTVTQARLEIAAAWHSRSGVWMSPSQTETAQQRLTRLANDLSKKVRTLESIVVWAPPRAPDNPVTLNELVPAWVVDPNIPVAV